MARHDNAYAVAVTDALEDPEWDAFVATRPGGLYVQSTAWAEVKRTVGWRPARVVVRRDGRIEGGCQLLLRSLPIGGAIGYAPRGPVLGADDPLLVRHILSGLDAVAAAERIAYCKVQPPGGQLDVSPLLRARGWVESGLEAGTTATVRVDLRPDPDELLQKMRSSTRYSVRSAARRSGRVRAGGYSDLGTFSELVAATSRRQRFVPYSVSYYRKLWRAFAERGESKLFLVEHEGEVVAANLSLGFGDTALYKMGAWTGTHAKIHPNELALWTALMWARDRGYHYYDFDGIDPATARAIDAGAAPPRPPDGVTSFKLGFGGDVVVYPRALDRSYRALLKLPVRWLAPRLGTNSLAGRVAGRGG